ncbi:MAG: type II secretion system F family protein [Patescibacteria group bacterium]
MKFNYSAKDKGGNLTRGIIEAADKESVVALITKDGSTPLVISEDKDLVPRIKNSFASFTSHMSLKDRLMFCEEMATLINSGVPLSQSLNIIKEQSKGTMRKVTESLLSEIEGGQSLAGALEKESKYFSPVFINMVQSGEASGTLDKTLNELAIQVQKDYELVSKIRGAMTYPVVIVVAMVGAVVFMMVKVVPALTGFFDEMGAKLPLPTRILILTSDIIVNYGIWIGVGLVGAIFGIHMLFKRVASLRRVQHQLTLKMPVVAGISKKFNIARITRTLGSLLGSGVSILESLQIVSLSTKNVIYQEEVLAIQEKVKNGDTLAAAMKESTVFPVMVSQMIDIGEETGNLDKMLIKVAENYERRIDAFTKNISSIIEPIIMLVVGGAIGFVIVSIIMPIYKMTESMGS